MVEAAAGLAFVCTSIAVMLRQVDKTTSTVCTCQQPCLRGSRTEVQAFDHQNLSPWLLSVALLPPCLFVLGRLHTTERERSTNRKTTLACKTDAASDSTRKNTWPSFL